MLSGFQRDLLGNKYRISKFLCFSEIKWYYFQPSNLTSKCVICVTEKKRSGTWSRCHKRSWLDEETLQFR